jgi:hypothetical protein
MMALIASTDPTAWAGGTVGGHQTWILAVVINTLELLREIATPYLTSKLVFVELVMPDSVI